MKILKLKRNCFTVSPSEGITYDITGLLLSEMLHGEESRARIRVISVLTEARAKVNLDRDTLIAEYTKEVPAKFKKSPKGKYYFFDKDMSMLPDEKGAVKYTDDTETLDKNFSDLFNKEVLIDVTPANYKYFAIVKNILINSKKDLSVVMAARHDQWCTAFEDIRDESELKDSK